MRVRIGVGALTGAWMGFGVLGGVTTPVLAQDDPTPDLIQPDLSRDGRMYPVTGFEIEYPIPHESLPDPVEIFDVLIPLHRTASPGDPERFSATVVFSTSTVELETMIPPRSGWPLPFWWTNEFLIVAMQPAPASTPARPFS